MTTVIRITTKTLLTLIVLSIFASCRPKGADFESKKGNTETIESNAQEIERKAQEYLQPLLHVGESQEDMVRRFGSPMHTMEISSNELCLDFLFSDQNHAAENAGVGGFDAFFVSNRLSHWLPIYQGPRFGAPSTEHAFFKSDKETFKWFVESDGLKNTLEALDSKGSTDASDLKIPPDLVFEAKVIIGNDTSQSSTNKMMLLTISDKDVSKMKSLSENNLGKRILVVCRNVVIAAPVINEPIASNQILISLKNIEFLEHLKK
jgi:hypothetical protein